MPLLKLTRRRFVAGLLAGAASIGAYARWGETKWLLTRKLRFSSNQSTHRFVHFTDLHHKGDREYLQAVINTINAIHPEFVCFTGDIVEEAEFLPESLELMKGIRAPLYGIPGNHDYWAKIDFGLVADAFAATGGKWLMDDEAFAAGGKVNVMGVTCSKPPNVTPKPGVKNVLLFHYPAWVQKLSGVKFDLMLAGHSHGGQVRLPFVGPLIRQFGVGQFDLGLYQTAAGPLYVNPGIGYFYIDVRFCCRPEITVMEI